MSIQKEDVYETEDLPEADQKIQTEETYESEDVQKIHIDVDSALKRFQGRLLNADAVDFSDSIARRRRAGYGCGAYVLEVVGSEAGEPETAVQKFNRLNYELNELLETLQNGETKRDKDGSGDVDHSEVMAMLATLKACKTGNKPTVAAEGASTKVRSALPQAGGDGSRMVVLEERLKRVEAFIGGADAVDDFSKRETRVPLAELMEDLRMRVQMLNPNNADGLHTRLNQLLAKVQEVEDKRKERTNSEFEQKVDTLYEMMLKWDEVCLHLPAAVQRVCDLHKLHEQAQLFNKTLSELVGVRAQIMKRIDGERVTVLDFKQQMAEAVARLSADMENLNKRLSRITS